MSPRPHRHPVPYPGPGVADAHLLARLDDHDRRLVAISEDVGEIKADVAVIRATCEDAGKRRAVLGDRRWALVLVMLAVPGAVATTIITNALTG